jgi:hypothetical protein
MKLADRTICSRERVLIRNGYGWGRGGVPIAISELAIVGIIASVFALAVVNFLGRGRRSVGQYVLSSVVAGVIVPAIDERVQSLAQQHRPAVKQDE